MGIGSRMGAAGRLFGKTGSDGATRTYRRRPPSTRWSWPKPRMCCITDRHLTSYYKTLHVEQQEWHAVESKEYRAWANMIARCSNPRAAGYSRYGGRGIKVCVRWRHSFDAFYADMGTAPSPQHELRRIDTDGGYRVDNVCWNVRLKRLPTTGAKTQASRTSVVERNRKAARTRAQMQKSRVIANVGEAKS